MGPTQDFVNNMWPSDGLLETLNSSSSEKGINEQQGQLNNGTMKLIVKDFFTFKQHCYQAIC